MNSNVFILFACFIIQAQCLQLKFSDQDVQIVVGKTELFNLVPDISSQKLKDNAVIVFTYQEGNDDPAFHQSSDKLLKSLENITLQADTAIKAPVNVTGLQAGHIVLGINSSSEEIEDQASTFLRINLIHSKPLIIINAIIGWVYFVAWSVSFYPQVYENFRRKSVIGLNFDFLTYNITGFLAYGLFNIGMFWVPTVKAQYHDQHPRGINPVQLNDVIFTIHAVFVTIITIVQCFIYQKGNQKVSKICIVLMAGSWLFAAISLVVTLTGKITWLTYLYYFSYIKLGITLIKYIPQAYMNYTRKSTMGWSIGNVLLDFTGGSLSLLQMFMLAYNSDDWGSIFGDPTKFGLGFFSILFDILFMIQHYVLYRNNVPYSDLDKLESEGHEETINYTPKG